MGRIFSVGFSFESHYLVLGVKGVPMQIIAQCATCGNTSVLDAGAADRRVRCRKCHKLFKVPKLDEVPKAIKVVEQAKGTVHVDEDGKTYG